MTHPRTIGILGGSFNPAHAGHLHISVEMMKRLGLDEIWWLVSPQNPLKSSAGMADFATRAASARALARHPRIKVSDFEQREQTQYTADTLRKLTKKHPRYRFVWLMGADSLAQIHRWKDWEDIFRHVAVAVYDRAPHTFPALFSKAAFRFAKARAKPANLVKIQPPCWAFLHEKRHPLSATFLRKTLGDKAFLGHN